MEVLVVAHVPDGTGRDYELVAVREEVYGDSQSEALSKAVAAAEDAGVEDLACVGLVVVPAPKGVRTIPGGIEELAALQRKRRVAEALPQP